MGAGAGGGCSERLGNRWSVFLLLLFALFSITLLSHCALSYFHFCRNGSPIFSSSCSKYDFKLLFL